MLLSKRSVPKPGRTRRTMYYPTVSPERVPTVVYAQHDPALMGLALMGIEMGTSCLRFTLIWYFVFKTVLNLVCDPPSGPR